MDPAEESRCKACILGAWVGDAIGGVLEFGGVPSRGAVDEAFRMCGGGVHKLGPGQVTDDSEMGISLLRGLVAGRGRLDLNQIASYYGKWFASAPFDVGGTIRQSVGRAVNMASHQAEMMRRGASKGGDSQSNGCLMRIAPLPVFLRHLPREDAANAVREEVGLTHVNETIQHACVLYCLTITHLLTHPGDRSGAFQSSKEFVLATGNEEVKDWLRAVEDPNEEVVVNRKSGWGKIALVYSLRSLLAGMDYSTAIREIVGKGGDTDTNACIIGAMLGAADGLDSIPPSCQSAVLCWSSATHSGVSRPSWLSPKETYPLVDRLIALAPRQLTVVGGRGEYPATGSRKK